MNEPNELWQPTSACGPDCLADDEPFQVASRIRGGQRLVAAAGVMLVAVALLPLLPLFPERRRARFIRWCARNVLHAFGIRVTLHGHLPARRAVAMGACGTLVVANHVSWLDIVVLLATERTRLVAKTEVGDWPVIGRIARYAGTIFVDRSRPRTLPVVVAEVRTALAAGDVVVVFPEGTTSCGRSIGRFRPAFFQAAVEAGAAVVPVTLRFRLAGAGRTSAAAFIGDETLLVSLRRILRLPGLIIELSCGAMIHPASGATRRSLARVAARAVGASGPIADREARRAPAPVVDPAASLVPLWNEPVDGGSRSPVGLPRAA
ncbi:lysophospholipid acyltransferase family protein [Rugosimonospora africana]|uniref:1-acyl-sn-glycerol-3-phosphate acyltransferase n=1 Tax=Rugosimonospora africana TaxID=556532 RepID=A0A8J3VM58_9ACTN|nr:lysophospholipid acyltransferase family protein [Rugosimonospora africana]GIH11979.1 1-acyl-sn-glycerol-3-phosphate acyltransferase [Rugosimonospora africana]